MYNSDEKFLRMIENSTSSGRFFLQCSKYHRLPIDRWLLHKATESIGIVSKRPPSYCPILLRSTSAPSLALYTLAGGGDRKSYALFRRPSSYPLVHARPPSPSLQRSCLPGYLHHCSFPGLGKKRGPTSYIIEKEELCRRACGLIEW